MALVVGPNSPAVTESSTATELPQSSSAGQKRLWKMLSIWVKKLWNELDEQPMIMLYLLLRIAFVNRGRMGFLMRLPQERVVVEAVNLCSHNNIIKRYAISHPQALAQCDNYLRSHGIMPIPLYDTAGSAKMLASDPDWLPTGCTPQNTAAIACDLAGTTYGLKCLEQGIEDDDSNFTRFLLLGRKSVLQYLNTNIPSKASILVTFFTHLLEVEFLVCFFLLVVSFYFSLFLNFKS